MGLRQYARVAVVGTILLMCVFTVRVFYTSNAMSTVSSENNYYMDSSEGLSDYIIQRNNISRLLVRGDRDSRATLMPIYGDLYQIKL